MQNQTLDAVHEPPPPRLADVAPVVAVSDPIEAEKARRREAIARMLGQAGGTGNPDVRMLNTNVLVDEPPFTEGVWGPYVNLYCRYCSWTSFHEEDMWQHYADRHLRDQARPH